MKILVFIGSARKANTYKLIDLVRDRLEMHGDIEFEMVYVDKLDIGYCSSCHNCILKGEQLCKDREIIRDLEQKMLEADGIIIAVPVYMLNVPASVKNLIDHFAYLLHRPILFDKNVLVITNTAGGGEVRVAKYLKEVFIYWGAKKVFTLTHKVFALNIDVTEKLQEKIDKVAHKFYVAIDTKKHQDPTFGRIAFFNVFRAMNILDKGSCDNIYYGEKGWFDVPYPVKVKNPIKNIFGNAIYIIMKKVLAKRK